MEFLFRFIFICIFFLFMGCAGSPMSIDKRAEENNMRMIELHVGMHKKDVINVLGSPREKEEKEIDGEIYSIWLYVTKGVSLMQSELMKENYTPLIFKKNILVGWGYHYYKYLLDIDDAKKKAQEAKKQQYTDDQDEWPAPEHRFVLPPTKQEMQEAVEKERSATKKASEPQPKKESLPEFKIMEKMREQPESENKKDEENNKANAKEQEILEEKIDSNEEDKKLPECEKIESEENYNFWE